MLLLRHHRVDDAVASLRQAVSLKPDVAAAHHGLAIALNLQGNVAAAITACRRAVALAPKLADAHSRLGNMLHAIGDRAGAAEAFMRAAAAARGTAHGRLNQAKALMIDDRMQEAEKLLRNAVALDPGAAEAHRLLGTLLAEAGRFTEAVSHMETSLAIDPTQVAIYHDLVHCQKLRESDRPLIERMLSRLDGPLSEMQRLRLNFALGKAYDDLDEPATAIRHFDAANRIKSEVSRFDRTGLIRQVDTLIDLFTPEFLAEHAGLGTSDPTPLLVIGMPRSGTTLVEQIVSSHPQVGAAGELDFWGLQGAQWLTSGGAALTPDRVNELAAAYSAVLARAAPGRARVTDKMPFNFFWVGLIHLVFPQARFLHCRRHPIDTCLSIYFTHFAQRTEFAARRDDLVCYFRQYERLMAHWHTLLPRDRLIDVQYESLVTDRNIETRRIIGGVGLAWDDACLNPERNQRIVRTATVWQARQPVYTGSLERWRRYENWLGELRDLVPQAVT